MSSENDCRTCGHCWEVHDHHGMKRCYQDMGEDYGSFEFKCDCRTGFVPSDNLQYLELEYYKRKFKDGTRVVIKPSSEGNETMQTE